MHLSMNKFECKCKDCSLPITWELPNICVSCLDYRIKNVKQHFPKQSIWKTFKRFSWVALLTMPPSWFVSVKFGIEVQWIWIAAFIYGIFFDSLLELCVKIF